MVLRPLHMWAARTGRDRVAAVVHSGKHGTEHVYK